MSIAKEVIDTIPEAVSRVLDVLAEKFGSTGRELWAAVVRQQFIDGWYWIFLVALILLGDLLLMIPWFGALAGAEDEAAFFGYAIWGLVLIVGNTVALTLGHSAITCIFNPVYAATKDILNMVKKEQTS